MISVVVTNRPCSFLAIPSCQISDNVIAIRTTSEIHLACGAPVPCGACFSMLIQLRHHSPRMLSRKGVSHFSVNALP